MSITIPDLEKIKKGRVLVVGDVMLDEYWFSDITRISPEAPVPVACIKTQEQRLGGASNVAHNLCRLGSKTALLSVVGEDQAGTTLQSLLQKAKIPLLLPTDPTMPTTRKIRIMGQQQQLIRLDFESVPSEMALAEKQRVFEAILDDFDVIIFSDYQKGGLLSVQSLIQQANARGKITLVDPKKNDWKAYRGATLITPNRQELRAMIGTWTDETSLQNQIDNLMKEYGWQGLLLTRSEEGMTLFQPGQRYHEATQAREVFDVSGAGDTVVATLAAFMAADFDIPFAMKMANLCAGIVVSKLGTSTVSFDELTEAFFDQKHTASSSSAKIVSESVLIDRVRSAQRLGQRIVMTNGCFDLLHPGHIQYLEQARALGDQLIIAVNDNGSVAKLKGPSRPIHDLDTRMKMLAALHCVDWVVPFSEETPQRLYSQVLPDLLVKGGDYEIANIAGAAEVIAHGGSVRVLSFLDGHSTTQTIHKIKERTNI